MTKAADNINECLRICVLGTSNAIFSDGYVKALRQHPLVSEVKNLSLGGSSSNAFSYFASKIDFSKFDYCIVDYCVNDATLFNSGFQNLSNVKDSLIEIILTIRETGCEPLFLMLPLKTLANAKPITDLYRKILSDYEVEYIDCYVEIERIASKQGCSSADLFDDPFHLKRNIASNLTIKLLENAHTRQRSNSFNRAFEQCFVQNFYENRQVLSASFPTTTRGTSLIQANLVDLNSGSSFDIFAESNSALVGLALDLANSRCVLSISGKESFRLSLTSFNFVGDRKSLILTVWPLPFAIRPINNIVRFNVLDDRAADLSLNHEISEDRKCLPPTASIHGFIFRNQQKSFLVPRRHSISSNAGPSNVLSAEIY